MTALKDGETGKKIFPLKNEKKMVLQVGHRMKSP